MDDGRPDRTVAATLTAAAAFLLLVLIAFWPVASGRRSFFHMDLYYEHLPVWETTQRALRSGESPFWLDGEFAGHPPLFHQEAPLFYPPTVPLLLTGAPVHRLADVFTLFHFWLAGLAGFLLVRALTGRFDAALFGGTAWMLSARMIQTALWPNAVAVSALVPLLLLGIFRIARGQRRSGVLWTGIAGGLSLLAARPHVLLAASPLVICFTAALILRAPARRRVLLDLGLAGALALALGAPSVLPTAALLPETSRSSGRSSSLSESDPQWLARGRDLDLVFLPVDGRGRWPEAAAYGGVLAYGLFLSGGYILLRRREPFSRTAFLSCAVGGTVGLLFAFGARGPYRYLAELPLLRSFRVPERFLFSWSLAVAVGSALALAYWLDRARRPRAVAALCVLGLAADLGWHARRAAPTADPEVYRVVPAIVPLLHARLGTDEAGFPRRFFSLAMPLDPVPFPDPVRLALLRNAGSLKGALGMRFGLDAVGGAGPALARTEAVLLQPTRRAFALGGVGAVVISARGADGAPNANEPPDIDAAEGLARALVVGDAVVVEPEEAVRTVLSPGLDPRRVVVLEEGEPLASGTALPVAAPSVRLIARAPGRVALEARLSGPGVLVLFESYEAGWRATVDGASVPVLRADGAFRAVRLASGTHRVEFFYVPPGLKEGLGLGAAGILGLILVAIRLRPESDFTGQVLPRV
jgi:Bacterial membrane protein YfhO